MIKEFSKTYFLIPGEANVQQEMPLSLLTSRIIEIATLHANHLNIGYANMDSENLGWVLSRLTIEMNRYPKVNEHYTITTWIESWNRHFSERNFEICDANGQPIGYVRTVWMVINTITHENAGTDALSLDTMLISQKECPIAKQAKLRPVEDSNPVAYTFRYTDIDFYRHVNTVRHIELLLNTFSISEFDNMKISRFEIAFMQEGKFGETIHIHSHTSSSDVIANNGVSSNSEAKQEISQQLEAAKHYTHTLEIKNIEIKNSDAKSLTRSRFTLTFR